MTINVTGMKKKLAKIYEETVRKATTKAIPIVKKEASKAIGKVSDESIATALNVLTIAAGIGVAIYIFKGNSTAVSSAPIGDVYNYSPICIENLTINLGGN